MAQAVVETLRKFAALRGWPIIISSDPGSQLESAAGKLETWWTEMKDPLRELAGKQGFQQFRVPMIISAICKPYFLL